MLLRSVFHHWPSTSTVTGMGGSPETGQYGYVYFHSTSSNWLISPTHNGWKQRFAQNKTVFDWSFRFFFATFVANWTICIQIWSNLLPSISPTRILVDSLRFLFTVKLLFPFHPAGEKKTPSKSNKSHELDLWTPTQQLKMKVLYLGFACFNAEKKSSNIG